MTQKAKGEVNPRPNILEFFGTETRKNLVFDIKKKDQLAQIGGRRGWGGVWEGEGGA